jgi:Glutamine phosphoribosylpyrophosphate amidotransferase
MSGIVGFFAFSDRWNVARFTYYGLLALQHRGRGAVGISLLEGRRFSSSKKTGDVEDLRTDGLRGWASVGYVGKSDEFPLIIKNSSIVIDGIADRPSLESLAEDPLILNKRKFAFISLNKEGKLVVGRDYWGLKPLYLGAFGFDMVVVSSEPSAIWAVGGELRREIQPGEVLEIDRWGLRSNVLESRRRVCSLEFVYLSRLDSTLSNASIYKTRLKLGELLAMEYPLAADVVVGVPETGVPMALGYSRVSGIPMELGFVRTGSHVRTMGLEDQFMRLVGAQLKLNPIREAFDGKKVILVDDSMVTGNTLRNTVQWVRRSGATEVHVLLGSPPLIRGCPYGMDVPDSNKLITSEGEHIERIVGANSIHWLSMKAMYEAIGNSDLCTFCMGGRGGEEP